jgi:uncharacterized membrane protein YfcA
MQENLFKLMEKIWLAGAAIGVIGCVYFLISKDNDSALFSFAFFLLSGFIYLIRKKQRIKHEEYLNEKKKAGK